MDVRPVARRRVPIDGRVRQNGGRQSEQQTCHERDGDAEDQHAPIEIQIERDAEKLKAAAAKQSNQSLAQDLRQKQSGNSPRRREETLSVSNWLISRPAGSTQGQANSDVPLDARSHGPATASRYSRTR